MSPIAYPLVQGFALVVGEQVHVGKGKGLILRAASLVAHPPSLDLIWAPINDNLGEFFHLGCSASLRTNHFCSHPW